MTYHTAYRPLGLEDAAALARGIEGLFPPDLPLHCEEIGDGNLNLVFRVSGVPEGTDDATPPRRIIIKQALPYAKVVGESWPLTLDRARIESEALLAQGRLVPHLVPKVYAYDPELALTVMEDLSDHTILRHGLMQSATYPLFAEHIAEFMAHTMFFTSDLGCNQQEKKQIAASFTNPELCKITEDLIFDDPYTDSPNNNCEEALREDHRKLQENQALHLEVMLLREKFLTQAQALLHGDLHTGSIFVTPDSTKVIDPEFAYYGPIGFDIGAVLANLLLNAAGHEYWSTDEGARKQHRDYLLATAEAVWTGFESRFRSLWNEHGLDRLSFTPGYQDLYMERILQDAVGYAGCKIIRRIVGLSHVADIDRIADDAIRLQAQRMALRIGKAFILSNRSVRSIREAITAAGSAIEDEYAHDRS